MADLAKLNRLRVNAGKAELKTWKASKDKLAEAIGTLEAAGHTDALPGANIDAAPVTTDPEVIKALTPVKKDDEDEVPSLADSALSKSLDNTPKPAPTQTKGKASLARGLDTDSYAKHSRERVRDIREKEKRDKKETRAALSDADKKQIKDEAESRKVKPAGAVDPKKDPEKAARQLKHIEDKQKARAEKTKDKPAAKEKNDNEISVADIARELDIDPKVARAKLRRHKDKLAKLYAKGVTDGWIFPKAAKAELVKILK
jgi:hypothetical protein